MGTERNEDQRRIGLTDEALIISPEVDSFSLQPNY